MYTRNAQPCQSQSMVKAVLHATRSPACMQRDWASTRVYARTCPLSIRLISHSNTAQGNGNSRRAKSSTTNCPSGASSLRSPASTATGSDKSCSTFVQVITSKVCGAYGRPAVSPAPTSACSSCTFGWPFSAACACASISALASTP